MFTYFYMIFKLVWGIDKTYYACKRFVDICGIIVPILNQVPWRNIPDPVVVWRKNISNMRLKELIDNNHFGREFKNNFLDK